MPRNLQDPTRRTTDRKKTFAKISRRLRKARGEIKRLFNTIPRTRTTQEIINNATRVVYEYTKDQDLIDRMTVAINITIRQELLQTNDVNKPDNWYLDDSVEKVYRSGALETVRDGNQIVATGQAKGVVDSSVAAVEALAIVQSVDYIGELKAEQLRAFNSIENNIGKLSTDVTRVIINSVSAGRRPADVFAEIDERFDASSSNLRRTVNTEINAAYNNAKINTIKKVAGSTGLRPGVIHVSALLPTTREWHAARHGNAYTPEQQNEWWDSDANRINCYCSTIPTLIDRNGNLINVEAKQEIEAEKEFFNDVA